MSYILVIINAIVVALMAVYINVNERRFHEMSTSHDRTGQYIENMVRNLTVGISDDIRRISNEQIAEKGQNIENMIRNLTVGISDDIRRISDERIAEKGQYIENMIRNLTVGISDDIRRISDERIAEKGQYIENMIRNLTVGISDDIRRISDEQIAKKGTLKIGFLASFKANLQKIPKGSVVVHDDVITNDGNSYNPSTGVFTASVEGLFFFSWTTTNRGDKIFITYMAVNGKIIARKRVAALGTNNLSDSQTVIVHLKKNDKVNIEIQDYFNEQWKYGDVWSTFSGFMI